MAAKDKGSNTTLPYPTLPVTTAFSNTTNTTTYNTNRHKHRPYLCDAPGGRVLQGRVLRGRVFHRRRPRQQFVARLPRGWRGSQSQTAGRLLLLQPPLLLLVRALSKAAPYHGRGLWPPAHKGTGLGNQRPLHPGLGLTGRLARARRQPHATCGRAMIQFKSNQFISIQKNSKGLKGMGGTEACTQRGTEALTDSRNGASVCGFDMIRFNPISVEYSSGPRVCVSTPQGPRKVLCTTNGTEQG